MRLPSFRFLVPLLPLISLAASTVSSSARAQNDAPGSSALPPLPETERANPPASSASPPPAPPVPLPAAAPPTEMAPPGPANVTQEPMNFSVPRYRHEGFYVAVDSGVGFLGARGSGPLGSASISGFATMADLAIGGTVAPGLVIGAALREWSTTGTLHGGPTITATTTYFANGVPSTTQQTLSGHTHAASLELGAFLDWYPNPERGWHVGASLGLGGMTLIDDAGTTTQSVAVAGSIFGGHEWWLGRSWSLGLIGVLSAASSSRFDDSNQNDTGYRLAPISVGIATQLLYY